MNGFPSHDRLINRYSLQGHMICEGAVHVGTSQAGDFVSASDMPVTRDGQGRPYIPGSSLRGALRSALESLLRGISRSDRRVCDPFLKDPSSEERSCSERVKEARGTRRDIGEEEAFRLAWENSCTVCRVFGCSFLASRLRIADLPLVSDPDEAPVYARDGVGIDRDLRTASRRILYSFEAVSGGALFDLRIEFENAQPFEMGLLLAGLDLFSHGLATVGGKTARGLGQAKVEGLTIMHRRPADFFAGGDGEKLGAAQLAAFREAARSHYLGEG